MTELEVIAETIKRVEAEPESEYKQVRLELLRELVAGKSERLLCQYSDHELRERLPEVMSRFPDVLKRLSYREREVIKLRSSNYTLVEVAGIFKVTRERIRQIEAKAVRKIQSHLRAQEQSQ